MRVEISNCLINIQGSCSVYLKWSVNGVLMRSYIGVDCFIIDMPDYACDSGLAMKRMMTIIYYVHRSEVVSLKASGKFWLQVWSFIN